MVNRLYVIPLSTSSATGSALLAHKRIPHRVITLPPGLHGGLLRFAGFEGLTVPVAEIEGRRLEGTLTISRALEELVPEPPLFGADPVARARIEAAEQWGEAELQPVPRRIFRYCLVHDSALRRWAATEVVGAPSAAGELLRPLGERLARRSGADREAVRADLAALPALLDRTDALIAEGTIGGEPAKRRGLPGVRQHPGAARVRGESRPAGGRPALRRRRTARVSVLARAHPPKPGARRARPQLSEGSLGMVASSR